jgi:hypothetical protein
MCSAPHIVSFLQELSAALLQGLWLSAANRPNGFLVRVVHGMLRHRSVCFLRGCTVFIKMSLTVQKTQRLYEPGKILTFPVFDDLMDR